MPATVVDGLVGAVGVRYACLLEQSGASSAVDFTAEDGLEERLSLGYLEGFS